MVLAPTAKKTATAKTRTTAKTTTSTKRKAAAKKAGDTAVTIDRRTSSDRRKKDEPVPVERRKLQRRAKVARRRQIDPTTCERDYTADEIEFMSALDNYKRASGRMFPTCSEVLEVLRNLGYEKQAMGGTGDAADTPGSQELLAGQNAEATAV